MGNDMTEISVSPDDSTHKLELGAGGEPALPRVAVQNDGAQPVPPQSVEVALPEGSGLQFGSEALPELQRTVESASGRAMTYTGSQSDDGQSLTFSSVDLALPGSGSESVMWVAVSASSDAPVGTTILTFTVGNQTSESAPRVIV